MSGENAPIVTQTSTARCEGPLNYDDLLFYDSPIDYDPPDLFVDPKDLTLAELRKRLLRRLGFSAQANTPPPGMKELLDDFLQDAQNQLYWKYSQLRTERYWTWSTFPGLALYDVPVECSKYLEFRKITEAWIQQGSNWTPLTYGISPGLYDTPQTGKPYRYEIRAALELWPVPDAGPYLVRIKGHLGLKGFTADGDKPTVDSEAVFLHALARAKAHYEQRDAANYERDLERYVGHLVAAQHLTKRYIPGRREWIAPPRPLIVE